MSIMDYIYMEYSFLKKIFPLLKFILKVSAFFHVLNTVLAGNTFL